MLSNIHNGFLVKIKVYWSNFFIAFIIKYITVELSTIIRYKYYLHNIIQGKIRLCTKISGNHLINDESMTAEERVLRRRVLSGKVTLKR